jgi:hypothetical protein
MKALLKLITTKDRARELLAICNRKGYVLVHKNHEEPLTEAIITEGGFTVNFGGYGSYSRLGLGNNFGSKWKIDGLDLPSNKGFSGVDVCFGVGLDAEKQKAIADFIVKQGGLILEVGSGNCDLCILASTAGDEQNLLELIGKMVDGAKGFLTIGVDEFLQVIPAIKKPRAKTAKASQLSDELKQLQNQLQERDYESINSALQVLKGRDADIDVLLQGVSVDSASGELDRGPKFKGSGPAMEYLDLALAGLLSLAGAGSEGARIRASIKKLRFAVKKLPLLKGFTALEDLEIILNRVDDEAQTEKILDLIEFGEFPALLRLTITNEPGYDPKSLRIKTINNLYAPLLEHFEVSDAGLENIDGLKCCTSLKYVDVSVNPDLSDISVLSICEELEVVRINETGIQDLEPISKVLRLSEVNLNGCRQLKNLRGLNADGLEVLELRDLDIVQLDGLENLSGLRKLDLAGLHKLKDLSPLSSLGNLEELELSGLTAVTILPPVENASDLNAITIRSCDQLEDVSALGGASALKVVSISECPELKVGPSVWPQSLQDLSIQHTRLSELGACPNTLIHLNIVNNGSLKNLDGISGCTNLEISSWGFDLTGCYQLQNLDGISLQKLDAIRIPETMDNLDALKRYPGIEITIVAGSGEKIGYRTVVQDIPASLGDALAALSPTQLIIKTDWSAELRKITAIGLVGTLKSLDLTDCNLADITGIAGLDKLERLKVQPRTELSKSLGKATFDSKGQIDKLRLKLLAGL